MSAAVPPAATQGAGLAIVCGGGSLPFAVADAALRQGRRVVLFPLTGWADKQRVTAYTHHWGRMGHWNRLLRIAAAEGCQDIVFIGTVTRPSLWQIQPDLRALWYVPRIVRLFRGGDDYLQSGIARIVESFGFRLRAPHEIAPEIMMPIGPLGSRVPTERDRADIALGLALLAANSPFDIGQAVVVGNNQVLAVEGPEGTDRTVTRVGELRRSHRIRTPAGVGVLVKAPKTAQDRRFDLPTIGPNTVASVVTAELAGIAVVAGTTIVAEPSQLAAAADRANIFVVGVSAEGTIP